MKQIFQSAADIADAIVASVGKDIVLGLPIGIGKAVQVVDALYARAKTDPSISLTIFTGLTLEGPSGNSDLEKRFLAPLVRPSSVLVARLKSQVSICMVGHAGPSG